MIEDYLRLLGQISNFSIKVTGTPVIDAYFGPPNILPDITEKAWTPDKLLACCETQIFETKEIEDELKRIAVTSDLESMKVLVAWLSGEKIPFVRLVEGLFGVTPIKFSQKEIRKAQQVVGDASTTLPGSNVSDKILRWREENKITGDALKRAIETEVVERAKRVDELFCKIIFRHFPTKVENRGVVYKTVKGEPWTAYNYYKGNYESTNVFNIDKSFNKHSLIGVVAHEYEHHAANVFKEKYCRENAALDLSALLLHTKRCIIDEGTANCARDFLGLQLDSPDGAIVESLSQLGSMVGLNVAYMLNLENADDETAAEYIASETFTPLHEAKRALAFSKPLTSTGKLNFWAPYVYTYFFGRRDYVLPTFQNAEKKGRTNEFFKTLYLNPYSRSTSTWKMAFSKI
jgi:hypothetical protein